MDRTCQNPENKFILRLDLKSPVVFLPSDHVFFSPVGMSAQSQILTRRNMSWGRASSGSSNDSSSDSSEYPESPSGTPEPPQLVLLDSMDLSEDLKNRNGPFGTNFSGKDRVLLASAAVVLVRVSLVALVKTRLVWLTPAHNLLYVADCINT